MSTQTTRLGMDVPASTDNISSFPSQDSQALGILDNAVIVTQGALASRPAATSVASGNQYFATDTNQLFQSTGSAWNQVPVVDSTGKASVLQLLSSQQLAMNYGTSGSVSAGNSVTITHGLGRTPACIQCTTFWADSTAGTIWTVYSVTSTQFIVANKGSTAADFYWLAIG